MEDKVEINKKDLDNMLSIGKKGLISTFILLVVMLFHLLVDFFYHT